MLIKPIKVPVAATMLGFGIALATLGSALAEKRHIVVAAVEAKGGVTVDKESFPTGTLPAGPGYILKKPDQNGRWEVSAYVWMPSQIIVNQGDDVTLEFVGINGAAHPAAIAGYNQSFTVMRGEVTKVSFKADKAGVFAIDCPAHKPSMRGELIVLPRR